MAGAVQGLGGGMVKNADDMRRQEEKDLDRKHDEALQKMRDTEAMSRQEQDQGFRSEQYDVMREDVLEDYKTSSDDAAKAALADRTFKSSESKLDRESDVFIQAMKMFQEETTGGKSIRSADGKWQMQVVTESSIPDPSQPWNVVEQDRFVVREPGSPLALTQHGTIMLPEGQTPEEQEKALAVAKSGSYAKAEKDLLTKAGKDTDDSSQFLEAFGYLPVSYFRKKMDSATGAKGFDSFYRRFRSPAGMPSSAPASIAPAAPAAAPAAAPPPEQSGPPLPPSPGAGPSGPPDPPNPPNVPGGLLSQASNQPSWQERIAGYTGIPQTAGELNRVFVDPLQAAFRDPEDEAQVADR